MSDLMFDLIAVILILLPIIIVVGVVLALPLINKKTRGKFVIEEDDLILECLSLVAALYLIEIVVIIPIIYGFLMWLS